MNKKTLFALWGGLFILCAGLGFLPEVTGFPKVLLTALAIGFFLPPFRLLKLSAAAKDHRTIALMRNLAALSLAVTVVTLVANFLSVLGSELLGNIVHYILVIVSTPMVCGQYWALSLFLWACLMIACHSALKKK